MAGTDETEVKDVERVEIAPTGDDETVETPDDTDQDSSPENEGDEDADTDESEESDEDEGAKKPEKLVTHPDTATTTEAPQDSDKGTGDDDDLADLPGETPRERALRLEVKRLKTERRTDRRNELVPPAARAASKPELTEQDKATLGKYKPEEINALREVIPALAKEMGFVRKDELESNTFVEKSQEVLDTFLDKHPEYLPENDADNTLWEAFKKEVAIYKPPASPKEYSKILEKAHREVFGIKAAKGTLPTVTAQREKTKAASHASASSATPTPKAKPATADTSGVRLDMLKGFEDDEKSELFGD